MKTYQNITFAKDYNKTFEEFVVEFSGAEVFKNMHPDVRSKELKTAYNIATEGKHLEVNSEEVSNGDTTRAVKSSKKNDGK